MYIQIEPHNLIKSINPAGLAEFIRHAQERLTYLHTLKLPDEVKELADQHKTIAAIKLLRNATGLSLAECKYVIDRYLYPPKNTSVNKLWHDICNTCFGYKDLTSTVK